MAVCEQCLPEQRLKVCLRLGLSCALVIREEPSLSFSDFIGTSTSCYQGARLPSVFILHLPQPSSWSSMLGTGAFCLFATVCIYVLESLWEPLLEPCPDCDISAFGWPQWERGHREHSSGLCPCA